MKALRRPRPSTPTTNLGADGYLHKRMAWPRVALHFADVVVRVDMSVPTAPVIVVETARPT